VSLDRWLDLLPEDGTAPTPSSSPVDALQLGQRAVYDDPRDFRVVYGGRRAGKSYLLAVECLMHTWPGEVTPFVAQTISKAKDIIFPPLRRIAREYKIPLHFHGDHTVILPNKGKIKLFSLDNMSEAEMLRGDRHPFAVLDEAGTRKSDLLKYALLECLSPATLEFRSHGGRGLLVGGSPSQHGPMGYWWELCKERGHKITIYDNPAAFPDPEASLAVVRQENGWTESTPEYRREYLGEFAISGEQLPYAGVWDGVVLPDHMAPRHGFTAMGLDIGYFHPNGWLVGRVVEGHLHLVHAEKHAELTPHQIAAKCREVQARWGVGHSIGDSSGNRLAIEALRKDHGIPIVPAEKPGQKVDRIEAVRGMLQCGTIHVYEGARAVADEFRSVPWNETHDDHHESYRDELCDALGYLVICGPVRQHLEKAEAPPPVDPSAARKAAALARARREGAPW
jgi:hypothetical protein